MPALQCPRCKQPNPEMATFCHFDGYELRASASNSSAGRLLQDFVFPSGKRCRSYDELAQMCQDDWAGARDLLRKGSFIKYFSGIGRMDLARAAQEGKDQPNADIGLRNLVASLPVSRTQGPRLDLHPRRLVLGTMLAGETQQVPVVVSNLGEGTLQGTVSVTEGGEWLRISGSNNGQCGVRTASEQEVMLQVDTRGLAAGEPYAARLTVVTNGGVVELPARLDVSANPFSRPPFQGASTPREMAERIRSQPKAGAPFLESGEICRWFESNGWNYPVRGGAAKGVAGVQQFFESMGLSKPPTVQLSQSEVIHICKSDTEVRGQVMLLTSAKKWVYANIDSDAEWLRVLTPSVAGPQQTQIGYEIDAAQAPGGDVAEGHLNIAANGGQTLSLRVLVHIEGRKRSLGGRILQPLVACAVAFLLLRLLLVPVVDFHGRGVAASAALARVRTDVPPDQLPAMAWGGWLTVPWSAVFLGGRTEGINAVIPNAADATIEQFRDYYSSYLLRVIIGFTWWIGAIAGVFMLFRRGNLLDAPWGLIAGAAAGVVAGATLGCAVLVGDMVPHLLWDTLFAGKGGFWLLAPWILLVVAWWGTLGLTIGIGLSMLGPLGRPILYPIQAVLAGLFRSLGMRRLSDLFAPA